jgi:glycosyltransferase involved in cell wall biosynthesis
VDAAAADEWLVRPGAIGVPDLTALYATADLLALPSLHEGFGLPALEAMAQGTPALLSDIPALRETAGSAARFVAPTDVDGWRAALVDLLGDDAERAHLAALGAARAASYSWDRCVERTVEVYDEALR